MARAVRLQFRVSAQFAYGLGQQQRHASTISAWGEKFSRHFANQFLRRLLWHQMHLDEIVTTPGR
ncbi:hypothetical protein CIT31_01415 [Mesorhizobium wenxiniae]|uniref:Uncharacterized protein n=1 Tax=Mesorhizobium wenxiniae TaxID=2014805 RepID=A0A271KRD9_9HYPH|nr:hypothetical protein CIT31_01415 [Mesorhizobium wenxiniae]